MLAAPAQSYPFSSIPENLKKRADAIVRSEQCLYTINKPGEAVKKIKKAVTIMNENSDKYRLVAVYYDKFSRIKNLKGKVYDEKGEIIKTLGIMDVFDMSAITGGSFYSDDRMKVFYFPVFKYPYTIEYEYEIEYSGILNYPSWDFQDDPYASVEKSGIQLIVPKDMTIRYTTRNLKNIVDSVITSDLKIYTWQEENLPAVIKQNYSIKSHFYSPMVNIAPLDFEFGGYKGSLSSWKTFGEWIYNLNKGTDLLPQTEMDKVKEIISNSEEKRERAKLIYNYVQANTRYVSIQIGIGGLRPAEASAVAENGFGDCKALANYTMALLNAAGINSFYTLVKAGENGQINKDFVANQFNHAILCVPFENDSVWLDCTSQTLPFNYLGNFTDDRYALLITPEGGKLVKTPNYKKEENLYKRTGEFTIITTGNSSGIISNYYSGANYGDASSFLGTKSEDEIRKYLLSALRYTDFEVSSASFSENKSEKPSADFSYGINVNHFTTAKGPRLYFNPSLSRTAYMQDIPISLKITSSNIETDSISYILPSGYKVEYLPSDVVIENEYGKFKFQLEVMNDRIIYKRFLEMNKAVIPKEKFNDLRDFINSIAKTDREKIILTKRS
jgi:hypothetical protein